ncbi:MAG: tetratricopeptide repeat protein [Leptospira sp.]|nr:tetratricopeptide repeat protein [Leptospira sp.]
MEKSHFHLLENTKLRTKMVLLVSGIVVLCVIPLSTIVYFKNKGIVIEKTYEVCRNIANNIAKIADDELLVGDTFEATNSALTKLKDSNVRALKDTYIINLDGNIVARLNSQNKDQIVSNGNFEYFSNLTSLTSREIKHEFGSILEFAYPIYIKYRDKNMRIGTAVFEFNSDEIFSPIVDLRNSIFFSAAILFVIGIGIALFLSISLSLPLQVLNEGAQKLGTGDFSHRINLKGKDEIGQLAHAFNLMGEKIQDFTQHLEKKVLERTDELNQSLEEVKALKEAQDGDYYLTSLLLEPLSSNNNFSKNVKTEFITEQKKKFSFRSWESQIGGDICITDTIKLRDKNYTVFLNADAMGKSIQGAGGALALGVVFNAGLIRSRTYAQTLLFPETWLKERFLDLQNVFLSFDGTMYISVCIGLVENETGLLYYMNAEHPWTVLYRDGKASFLEGNVDLCKIGTPGQENRFFIKTFQLYPGDQIITGSDGRDDLIIGYDENIEMINEDGNQFLKRVEEGKGDLKSILEKIKMFGKLYDDISLIKISFDEPINYIKDTIPTNEQNSTIEHGHSLIESGKTKDAITYLNKILSNKKPFPALLNLLGQGYMEIKQWDKAIECYTQYLSLNPIDNDAIFQVSKAFLYWGKKAEAADFGERLLLRDPNHIPNLINLAEIHIDLGIFVRAKTVIEKVFLINPNHARAKEILNTLNSKNNSIIDAELQFGEISRKSPDDQKMEAIQIGDRLFRLKKYSESLKYYLKAEVLDPKDIDNIYQIGNVYFLLEDQTKAIEKWQKCLALDPKFKQAIKRIESIEREKSKTGRAK